MKPNNNHFTRVFYHSYEENTVVPSFLSVLDHLTPHDMLCFINEILKKNKCDPINKNYKVLSFQIENHKSIYFDINFGPKEPDFGIKLLCTDEKEQVEYIFIFEAKINGYGLLDNECSKRVSNYYETICNYNEKNIYLIGISEKIQDKDFVKKYPGALYVTWKDIFLIFTKSINIENNELAKYLYNDFKEYFYMKGKNIYNFNENFLESLDKFVDMKIRQRKTNYWKSFNNFKSNITNFIDTIRTELFNQLEDEKITKQDIKEDKTGNEEELFEYSFVVSYNTDISIRVRYNIWIGKKEKWMENEKDKHGRGKFVCYCHFKKSKLKEKIYSHFSATEVKSLFNSGSFRDIRDRYDFIAIDFHGHKINWSEPEILKENIVETVKIMWNELKKIVPKDMLIIENAE